MEYEFQKKHTETKMNLIHLTHMQFASIFPSSASYLYIHMVYDCQPEKVDEYKWKMHVIIV